MARLMLSAGMLAARADSVAAFRRRLPLGSPPPFLAATVISRRILEQSLPRWTSVLPFFRLICDHRECPDIPISYPLGDSRFRDLTRSSRRARRSRARVNRRCSAGVSGVNGGHGRGRSGALGSEPRWTEGREAGQACLTSPVHGTSLRTFTPISREDVPTRFLPPCNGTTPVAWIAACES